MELILVVIVSTLNIVCFLFGAKIGQQVSKDEQIKVPEVNPMKVIREHHDRKEAEKEQERIDVIMRNLENYDGTGNKQEDVPGGSK